MECGASLAGFFNAATRRSLPGPAGATLSLFAASFGRERGRRLWVAALIRIGSEAATLHPRQGGEGLFAARVPQAVFPVEGRESFDSWAGVKKGRPHDTGDGFVCGD